MRAPTKTHRWGTLGRIRAFLDANPGATIRQIMEGLADVPENAVRALVADAVWRGQLWRVGLRGHFRFFNDEALAKRREPEILASIYADGRERLRRKHERYNDQRRAAAFAKRGLQAPPKIPRYAALDTEILRLAGEAEGFECGPITIADCTFAAKIVGSRVGKLCRLELLHKGKLSHKTVRYFRSKEAADCWVLKSGTTVARPAPVTLRLRPIEGAEVIVPPHVKVQRIPHRPGRFEVSVPKGRGQISQDWYMARQGVDLRAALAG